MKQKSLTGWHVLIGFSMMFATIICANAFLVVNALRSYPGLEVANSYIASQNFEAKRSAQISLNWKVVASAVGNRIEVNFSKDGVSIQPYIEHAQLSRPADRNADQLLSLTYNDNRFSAPITLQPGLWTLRLHARSEDGILFQKRLAIEVAE